MNASKQFLENHLPYLTISYQGISVSDIYQFILELRKLYFYILFSLSNLFYADYNFFKFCNKNYQLISGVLVVIHI